MGTWDIGPFDNDTAVDSACAPDEGAGEEGAGLIRGLLCESTTTRAPSTARMPRRPWVGCTPAARHDPAQPLARPASGPVLRRMREARDQ